ncbi:MAG: tatB [Proteobacteria bacterium]|nr:tatB [Pseudomonadota bacterium]
MFDVGFSELVLIGIVALVVFGPEDLPRVARTVGHLLGKFRRYVADVKSDISQEMALADVKRLHDELKDGARNLQDSLQEQVHSLGTDIQQSIESLKQGVEEISEPPAGVPVPPAEPEPAPFVLSGEPPAEVTEAPAQVETDENQLDLFGDPIPPARKA